MRTQPDHTVADVTVITPAYRSAETIGRALRSVAAQTLPPKRVIVVDDGSDDATVDVAESCRGDMNGIELTVLEQAHRGPGAARNLALSMVDTDLVAFLDADDEWLPEKLARTLPVLEDSAATLVSHDMVVVDGAREHHAACARHLDKTKHPFVSLFKRGFVATSTVVAPTQEVRAGGGFDESLPAGQDYDLWLSMVRSKPDNVVVLPERLTRYHVMGNSITSKVAQRRQCALRIVGRHAPALDGRAAYPALTVATRVAIICYEAAGSYAAKGRWLAAAGALLSFVPSVVRVWAGGYAEGPRQSSDRFSGSGAGGSDPDNPISRTRSSVETHTEDRQERNRLWWEELPMTYAEWSEGDRVPRTLDDFKAVRAALIGHSPFLRERYDFAALNGREVLDLGCGSGVTACLLAEGGASVTAVDLTQMAVGLTRQAAATWDVPVRVARIDAERMAFAGASFDYVFSWGVLHHTNDTNQAFHEVCRVLRRGGQGMIMVYHKTSLVYYLKGLYWLLLKGKIFQGHDLESVQGFFVDGYYHRHFTRRSLRAALQGAGLHVDDIVVTQMQKKILPLVPRPLDLWLKDRFGWLIIARFSK